MKNLVLVSLVLALLFSVAFSEENKTETVVQMTYILKMPDVIREGLYTGEVLNGVPHGYGVFTTVNSSGEPWHYLGQWENGVECGEGGCYWNFGQTQIGTYSNNAIVEGYTHTATTTNFWRSYTPNDHGCYDIIEYRTDGSVLFDGCMTVETGDYHIGTFYTKDNKVFLSGEIGEGFNWNLVYIE